MPDMPSVKVDMRIDVARLLLQKEAVLRAIDRAENDKDVLLLDGVLNVLDQIHDTVLPPD